MLFEKKALMDFYSLPMKSLEASEKLEQLRYLEYGKKIRMIETTHVGIGIDTPEDLERARKNVCINFFKNICIKQIMQYICNPFPKEIRGVA